MILTMSWSICSQFATQDIPQKKCSKANNSHSTLKHPLQHEQF